MDFIKYDNHTGVTLLKTSLMNTLNKVSRILDLEIELNYIPYSLILDCLDELKFEYSQSWNNDVYSIDVYSTGIKIMNICGNVTNRLTTISNRERTEFFV